MKKTVKNCIEIQEKKKKVFVLLFLSRPLQNEKLGIFERRNRAVRAEKCTKKRRDVRAELLFWQQKRTDFLLFSLMSSSSLLKLRDSSTKT